MDSDRDETSDDEESMLSRASSDSERILQALQHSTTDTDENFGGISSDEENILRRLRNNLSSNDSLSDSTDTNLSGEEDNHSIGEEDSDRTRIGQSDDSSINSHLSDVVNINMTQNTSRDTSNQNDISGQRDNLTFNSVISESNESRMQMSAEDLVPELQLVEIDRTRSENEESHYSGSEEDSIYLEDLIFDLEENLEGDHRYRYQQLFDMIESEEANVPINSVITFNTIEIWLSILKFSLAHHLPTSAIIDQCRMINSFIDIPVIEQSRYFIDKLFNTEEGREYHLVCPDCGNYLGKCDDNKRPILCNICDIRVNLKNPCYRDFFIILDIQYDLKKIVEVNSDYYLGIINRHRDDDDNFKDFQDGQLYKAFVRSLPLHQRQRYVTITFNSDGAPVFVSSKFSIWPIQIIVNEVPEQIRSKKTIVFGVWFGHDKPDMLHFLKPFVEKMNQYATDGIQCQLAGESTRIYPYCLCCCVDSTARPPMQGIIQFNGYYGCNWCLHEGERVFHNRGSSIKYTLLDEIPLRRNAEETFNHMVQAVDLGLPVFGVKHPTPLINLRGFNIIDGFVPDPMHCIDLGIGKKFLHYWFNTSNQLYSKPKQYMAEIDAEMKTLKVPTQVMRLSRSLSDFKFWKAKEFQNWILYYSLVVLAGIPEFEIYLEHWALLVEAYHLLMQNSISLVDLERADRLLKTFVADTEILYGAHAMTFNMHQLLHLTQSVADWGPLWCHTGYTFEAGNYRILQSVHAANGVLSQVCRNLSFQTSIRILEEYVRERDFPIVNFLDVLDGRETQRTERFGINRYFGKPRRVLPVVLNDLVLPPMQTVGYDKLVRNMNLYKTCESRCQRSENSYACLRNGNFVHIQQFIVNRENNAQYVAYKLVELEPHNGISDQLTTIRRVSRINDRIDTANIEELEKLCVFMDLQIGQYIAALPHMYWR